MTPVSLLPLKVLAKVFSRGALESYLPRLQDTIKSEIAKWCSEPGSIDVYSAAKSLTFRIAVAVLLGLQLEEERIVYLAKIFEQLMNNLFSLPIDAPFSGLRKVSDLTVTLVSNTSTGTSFMENHLFSGYQGQRDPARQHGEDHRGENAAAADGGRAPRLLRLYDVQCQGAGPRAQHPGAQGTKVTICYKNVFRCA